MMLEDVIVQMDSLEINVKMNHVFSSFNLFSFSMKRSLFIEDEQLCRGVNCFFDHPCGISRFGHTYRSKCFCRRGFQGEFCQSKGLFSLLSSLSSLFIVRCSGVLSNCSVSGCSSGGSCFEQLTGNQRWKFCLCQSGWIGNNCQKRLFSSPRTKKQIHLLLLLLEEYFRCSSVGFFVDQFFDKQGKYFQCRLNNNKGQMNISRSHLEKVFLEQFRMDSRRQILSHWTSIQSGETSVSKRRTFVFQLTTTQSSRGPKRDLENEH